MYSLIIESNDHIRFDCLLFFWFNVGFPDTCFNHIRRKLIGGSQDSLKSSLLKLFYHFRSYSYLVPSFYELKTIIISF